MNTASAGCNTFCPYTFATAEGCYTKLLGRRPDHRPMPTLLHWELSDEGGLMLSSSQEIPGARAE